MLTKGFIMYLSEIAKIINGKLQGTDVSVSSFNTNSRELMPGEVFIALRGEQFDGHDFLQSACEKKAAAVITSMPSSFPVPSIQVENTRIALGQIAAHHRQQFQLPLIAVTGSCGKTTTKTMIASILSHMGPTLAPIKSFNNDVGVPVTLLQLTENHNYAVIEMGANHLREIAYLSQLARQNVALITNVAPAHLEGFGTLQGVATAKGEIYEALTEDGIAILNSDDKFVEYWQRIIKCKSLTFGIKHKADVTAKNITLDREGHPSFEVHYPDGTLSITLPLLGIHNVMNALAATTASFAVGASASAIKKGLTQVHPVSKRLVKYKGLSGSLIIDDTYNANPLSVSAALQMLAHGKGEKIFVFGDMAELGHQSEKLHEEIGRQAKDLGIDKLYACGKLSHLTVEAFGDKGIHFKDQSSLIEALKPALHADATVLIKGSRSSRMENVVQAIIQEN